VAQALPTLEVAVEGLAPVLAPVVLAVQVVVGLELIQMLLELVEQIIPEAGQVVVDIMALLLVLEEQAAQA
jgi:hypothetical protein